MMNADLLGNSKIYRSSGQVFLHLDTPCVSPASIFGAPIPPDSSFWARGPEYPPIKAFYSRSVRGVKFVNPGLLNVVNDQG